MHTLEIRVLETVRKFNMIDTGDSVVIGLSGGPDSVCLLNALASLREELGIRGLHAVHVNHGLRGEESDGDEACARIAAESAGASFASEYFDVAALASEQGLSQEAMGRKLRYETFEFYRKKYGAQKIAVAHNLNDRAETVLMRIIRGTGIKGLKGIEHVRDGVIVRPLLDIERSDIEAYCRDRGLEPRIDSSNGKMIYTRNRIRLGLLPELERDYNPKIREALIRLADQAAETEDLAESIALEYLDGAGRSGNRDVPRWNEAEGSLDLEGFEDLHPAAAGRAILICAQRMDMGENISAAILQRLVDTALGGEPAEADVTGGGRVLRTYGKLWFIGPDEKENRITEPVPVPFEELENAGTAELELGRNTVKLTLEDCSGIRSGELKSLRARGIPVLDYDRLKQCSHAVFRNRRAGDRIQPRGMKGSRKLQDFLTDRKIPRHLRDGMILIAAENRILLAGGEAAGECAPDETAKKVLKVWYNQQN